MSFDSKSYDKVNWLHAQTLDNGFKAMVSEKTGIVKLTLPNSFITVMMYKDQFEALGVTNPEVLAYIKAHDSSIRTSTQNRESKKLNTAQQKLVKAIAENPALNDEQKKSMIEMLSKVA